MAKSPKDIKITEEDIREIGTEVSHIRALVELLYPESELIEGPIWSGLKLIDGQVEKINDMLGALLRRLPPKEKAPERQEAAHES